MNRNHIFSFVVSTLCMWMVCYMFNTTAILGKIVLAKTFISLWLTFTTVMHYLHLGAGVAEWLAYTLSGCLLVFIWASLYFFVYSVKRAYDSSRLRR